MAPQTCEAPCKVGCPGEAALLRVEELNMLETLLVALFTLPFALAIDKSFDWCAPPRVLCRVRVRVLRQKPPRASHAPPSTHV